MEILKVENLTKTYGSGENLVHAVDDVSFSVEKGEFVAIVGTSGSGKSTLLNMIGGLDVPTSGKVIVDGRELSTLKDEQLTIFRRRKIGFIFQNYNLVPVLNVYENIVLPVELDGNKVDKKFMKEVVRMLGLEDKLDVRMGALSGGQRQAVALLMATMTPLKFLILDEHTAALDPKTAEVIMALTDRVIREKHLTAMMVTHNLRYAVEYGDRILMMNRGRVVLDRAGAEKRATSMDDILTMFNQISLETGN